MPTTTPQPTVINANNDAGLSRVYQQDNQRIIDTGDGTIILVTDKDVNINLFEQIDQQTFITSVTEVNNPAGNLDGEIQVKQGNGFGVANNLYVRDGVVRLPAIATDNLFYANGNPWSFAGGSGVAYGNTDVASYLVTGTAGSLLIGNTDPRVLTTTLQGNVVSTGTLTVANIIYSNGAPVVPVYNDGNVITLLAGAGSNSVGAVVASGLVSTRTGLYVRPSNLGGGPAGGTAIFPGLPNDTANVITNIYDIGSTSRVFRNLYLGNSVITQNVVASGTVSASDATVTGNISITSGNLIISTGSIIAAIGVISANNITANTLTTSNVRTNELTTTGNTTLAATTAASMLVQGSSLLSGTVSVFGALSVANTATIDVGNLRVTGGAATQFLRTDGLGNLSWQTVSVSNINNGSSNVTVLANSAITVSSNGIANVAVFSNTGAVFSNLTVTGNTVLGEVDTITILGGSPGQLLSTDGLGALSWSDAPGSRYFTGNAASAYNIASTSEINLVLPAGVTARTGDIFVDSNGNSTNTQPVYLNVNGQWRQILTAFGGL